MTLVPSKRGRKENQDVLSSRPEYVLTKRSRVLSPEGHRGENETAAAREAHEKMPQVGVADRPGDPQFLNNRLMRPLSDKFRRPLSNGDVETSGCLSEN